jgi:hypothetical protein
MDGGYNDDELRRKLIDNVSLLEATGAEMYRRAYGVLPDAPMVDAGISLTEHLTRAEMRADVRGQLERSWFNAVTEFARAAAFAD